VEGFGGGGKGGDAHLEVEPVDAAEGMVDVGDLFGDLGSVADDEGAGGTAEGIEGFTGDGWPAAFAADPGESAGAAGEEFVGGWLGGVGDVAEQVETDFELGGVVAGALAGFAVGVDEGGGIDGARRR